MLQEIVLVVCVLMQPSRCEPVHLQVASEYGESLQVPFNCMKQGQIQAVKWVEEHPDRSIAGWKCPPPGSRRADFRSRFQVSS